MKHLLFLLFGSVAMLWPNTSYATDSNPSGSVPSFTVLRPKTSGHPHAPSLLYIECEYGDGFVHFTLPSGIYYVNVTLSNDSYTWTGYASRDFPKMEIPSLIGEYTIRCEANDGRVFYGTLVFSTGD